MGDGHNTGISTSGGGRDQILVTINPLGHPIFVKAQLSGLFIFQSAALNTPNRLPFEGTTPIIKWEIGLRRKPTALKFM